MSALLRNGGGRPGAGLTRDLIVATAREMIEKDGLEDLSLRRLAERLGVTATALYKHVESKRELLRCVARVEFDRLTHRLTPVDPNAPALVRLRRFARAYFDFARENPTLYPVLFLLPPNVEQGVLRDELPSATAVFRQGLAPIRDAIEEGEIALADPVQVALVLWTAMHGAVEVSLMNMGLGREREDGIVELLIEGVIAAVRAPAAG